MQVYPCLDQQNHPWPETLFTSRWDELLTI